MATMRRNKQDIKTPDGRKAAMVLHVPLYISDSIFLGNNACLDCRDSRFTYIKGAVYIANKKDRVTINGRVVSQKHCRKTKEVERG